MAMDLGEEERENLTDSIDGELVRLNQCTTKLTKARESIYEAKDHRIANEANVIKSRGW